MKQPPWAMENSAGQYIPYVIHPTQHCLQTRNGNYVSVVRLDGLAHEAADVEDVDLLKTQLNNLWRNLASPNVSFWTHIVRHVQDRYPEGEFNPGFARDLNEKYRERMRSGVRMLSNELYLSVVYNPHPGVMKMFSSSKGDKGAQRMEALECLDKIEELQRMLLQNLDKNYSAQLLGLYTEEGRMQTGAFSEYRNMETPVYSELLEFMGYLCNGEWRRMLLPCSDLSEYIMTARPFLGGEVLELRLPERSRFGGILAIKEYVSATEAGLMNILLSVPFECVLTQSFMPLSRPRGLEEIRKAQAKMIQAGEVSETLIGELAQAQDEASSGHIVMGEHHWSLLIFGDTPLELKDNLSTAKAELSNLGMVLAREDLAMEAAFWAQLPGNFSYRPRPALITSKNFSGFSSFHNYPCGRIEHNQWGPAVTMFRTASGSPFYFNFHEALDFVPGKGAGQQKSLGNTLIIGPSGSGKTVVQAFSLVQAQKFKPTSFIFDKDRGLELCVRRLGGTYLPLKVGEPTGFNPFHLENTPANSIFLESFVKTLITGSSSYEVGVMEAKDIAMAVRGVLNMPLEHRSLSSILAFLDPSNPEGAHGRLRKWVRHDVNGLPGSLSWTFDSGPDLLDFSQGRTFGFDVTEFLDDDEIRRPVIMYLFYRMEQLIDGRRLICLLDEFWKMLMDPYFQYFCHNKLKTIRKQNGIMIFGTQSAQDVLRSEIAHSIIEQCPTKIFMPNDKADKKDFCEGFKLSGREFQLIKETPASSRRFLIRQGISSAIAELNLRGFEDELSILSGTTDNVLLLERLMEITGATENDETLWTRFHEERRGK